MRGGGQNPQGDLHPWVAQVAEAACVGGAWSRSRLGLGGGPCGPERVTRALSLCTRKASSQGLITLTENSVSVLVLCGFFS